MALDRPYTTVALVEQETRNSSASLLTKYEDAINIASRWIDEFCNRDFWFHDHSGTPLNVKPDWVVGRSIFLPWPVRSLTAITEDGTTVLTTDYRFDNGPVDANNQPSHATGEIIRKAEWTIEDWDEDYITLTGTFGWGDGVSETAPPSDVPSAVRRACTRIAANWSIQNRKEEIGLDGQKVSLLDVSVPDEVKMLLMPYKITLM